MIEKYDITDYLKDDRELQKAVIEEFLKEIEELKAENDRLRTCLEIQRTDETNQYITKVNVERENCKLKQTLQEIKEIAERQLLVTNVRTYQMVYYADFSEYRNEILQKITKAESEKE